MGQRFLSYKELKANIRDMRASKKIVESQYLPPNEQVNQIIASHDHNMSLIEQRFSECDSIQDRM
jgi:hypothetical protein